MEAVSISEMSVYFHETIRSNILEQTFSNCGTRTTNGTPITVQQYTGLVRNNEIIKNKKSYNKCKTKLRFFYLNS
jgi:hypothetical protein